MILKKGSRILFLSLLLISSLSFAQNAALVIIDMQPYFMGQEAEKKKPENQEKVRKVLQEIRVLIRYAKKNGIPIALVEYRSCGPTCQVIIKEIGDYRRVQRFQKLSDGLFEPWNGAAQDVKEFLDQHKVSKLIMVGANGGVCVKCSIEGGLKAGYEVWSDMNAVIDFNSKNYIHPYRYVDGELSFVDRDSLSRFSQQRDIDSLKEFIKAKASTSNQPVSNMKCLKDLLDRSLVPR